MERAYGKPELNEDELEKLHKDSQVRVVVLQQPALMHPEVTEYREPEIPTKPAFLTGETIQE
jgi:hypothetical protein